MAVVAGNTHGVGVNIHALVFERDAGGRRSIAQSDIVQVDTQHFLVVAGLDLDDRPLAGAAAHAGNGIESGIDGGIVTAGSADGNYDVFRCMDMKRRAGNYHRCGHDQRQDHAQKAKRMFTHNKIFLSKRNLKNHYHFTII